ncbi:MAG: hypothetical protein Q7S40_13670 [Opitutaceae bacterium]|nr:hypothetical protein [Opitutaceae bacterium]
MNAKLERENTIPRWLGAVLVAAAQAIAFAASVEPAPPPVIAIEDRVDSTYGSRIRQLRKDDGHEHNLYYIRNPWNADSTRIVVIHSDANQKDWRVALCDGDGRFQKYLFPISEYDWRIVWDRRNPDWLYTTRGSSLFRYDVAMGRADLLKKFKTPLRPTGASLNQAGDRILVATADWTFHSYSLPNMTEERTFRPAVPKGYNSDKPAYTGYRNTIHVGYTSTEPPGQGILIYTDAGELVHEFKGMGGGGHWDFSPEGKLAYFKMPRFGPVGEDDVLEIRVVNLDGSDDRLLFSAPRSQTRYLQNLHLSWPDKVNDWFVASLFPNASRLPKTYAPLLDEIIQIKLDGTHRFLARSETAHARAGERGVLGDMFWAQPLASPSADGRRIFFNSVRSGTIDGCILYVGP